MNPMEAAFALHRQGRLEEAARIYRSVLEREPYQQDALLLLGMIVLSEGKPEEAERLLRRSLELNPKNPAGHSVRGVALARLDRALGLLQSGAPDAVHEVRKELKQLRGLLPEPLVIGPAVGARRARGIQHLVVRKRTRGRHADIRADRERRPGGAARIPHCTAFVRCAPGRGRGVRALCS